MAKIIAEGNYPRRIGDYILYPLHNDVIIRTVSGFTTKALKTSPKYELCRQNASEFGRVSAMCKQIRIALQTVLPKKNNLLVVNSLTKKMRQVLVFDVSSQRGERILANAMATKVGRQQLQGYHFNPEAAISLAYTLAAQRLQVDTTEVVFPEGASCIGVVALAFGFDFKNAQSQLVEGERQFYSQEMMPDVFDIKVPVLEERSGVAFVILEIKFYTEDQGSYVPVEDDRSAVVMLM